MTALLLLALVAPKATHYSPELMAQVAENRGMSLDGYEGGVALNLCGDLGRAVWLQWGSGIIEGPFLAVDCAQRRHLQARLDAGYIVEVSYRVAARHGFAGVGPVPVRVMYREPRVKQE